MKWIKQILCRHELSLLDVLRRSKCTCIKCGKVINLGAAPDTTTAEGEG